MLYYIVTHNVTNSNSIKVETTTNLSILLNEAQPGEGYLVTVKAVNIVGSGANATDICLVKKGLISISMVIMRSPSSTISALNSSGTEIMSSTHSLGSIVMHKGIDYRGVVL